MSHKTHIAVAGDQHGYNLSLRSDASDVVISNILKKKILMT
jgi:hypothetical protein